MIKLERPTFSIEQTIDICCQGITGNNDLLRRVRSLKPNLEARTLHYVALALAGTLYNLPQIVSPPGLDPVIIGELTKSELVKLYSFYFASSKKPGRIIYDALMVAADEKCPFCGGIGRPRNLDHFLPKSCYPELSVLPLNLVPSCRDCNMDGKGSGFASIEQDQVIQPYLDNEKFFNEQWIFARYHSESGTEPETIEYFVQPPAQWEEAHRQRVIRHFKDFDLALRYSREAAPRLCVLLLQIKELLQVQLGLDEAKQVILQSGISKSPFVNHWERILCLTLMDQLHSL